MASLNKTEVTNVTSKVLDNIKTNVEEYVLFAPFGLIGLAGIQLELTSKISVNQSVNLPEYVLENRNVVSKNSSKVPTILTIEGKQTNFARNNSDAFEETTGVVEKVINYGTFAVSLTSGALALRNQIENDIEPFKSFNTNLATITGILEQLPIPTQIGQLHAYLSALQDLSVPILVITPSRIYPNMVIKTLIASSDTGIEYATNFTIELKQITFGQVTSSFNTNLPNIGINNANTKSQRQVATQTTPPQSFLNKILKSF